MEHRPDATDAGASERAAAAREIARVVMRRRTAGEPVSDAEVIAQNDCLLPELAAELRKLALIERAAAAAHSTGTTVIDDSAPIGTGLLGFGPVRIHGYEIVREIGRGGQGLVYEAIQQGTRRPVAIKVIRCVDCDGDGSRFEREVRILGRLRHPNIAAIHESGRVGADDYFVMDFIDGVPLDEWIQQQSRGEDAADHPATLRRVVGAFATISDAVNAAHLIGVIHRDLKPANIRVDRLGTPFILDFGLARPADATDASILAGITESGQFVGSLPWCSPEQVSGLPDAIDIRTDVYALGVMLYRALAGHFPYEVRGPLPEVWQRIRHASPLPLRRARESPLAPLVDGDLEAIVFRCLAKEPERRYQSAGELARDLNHHLAGEAIDARRDSSWYVLRKALRRYRVAAGVVCAFAALAAASAVLFAVQARQVRLERDRATAARAASEKVSSFLEGLLSAADPFSDPRHRGDITLRTAVDLAAGRIEREFAGDPLLEAAVRNVIGRTYRELGALGPAEANLQRALDLRTGLLPAGDPGIAESLHELAVLRQMQERFGDAEALCRRALAIRSAAPNSAVAETTKSRLLLANLLRERNQLDDAEAEARAAVTLADAAAPALLAESQSALGGVLRARGGAARRDGDRVAAAAFTKQAEAAYGDALRLRRESRGGNHPDVATSLNNLAALYCEQGRWAEAIPLMHEALEIYRARLGGRHVYLARVLANLGAAYDKTAAPADAERCYRQALDIRTDAALTGEPDTAYMKFGLAMALVQQQRDDEARGWLEQALESFRETRGPADAHTRGAALRLAELYRRTGAPEKAAQLETAGGEGDAP